MPTKPTRKSIFRAYNQLRGLAEFSDPQARGRLNRGLGIAMSKRWGVDGTVLTTTSTRKVKGETVTVTHRTTDRTCTCEDHLNRPQYTCKHLLARQVIGRAWRLDVEDRRAAQTTQTAESGRSLATTEGVSMR